MLRLGVPGTIRINSSRVVEFIGPTNNPIVSENPIIPVLAGQRPYVLDPWMVRLLRKHAPGFEEPLLERLRNRTFSAVVLSADPAQIGAAVVV